MPIPTVTFCAICTFTDLIQIQRASVNCHDEQVPRQLEKCEGSGLKIQASEHVLVYNTTHISKRYWPPVSRKLQSVHNFLPSDTTWRSEAHCRSVMS